MKKLASIFLTLVMILGLSTNAFAANETYTLTISGATGHVYDVYQIYTGDISKEGDKTVLSNVKYGLNHYPVDGNVGTPVPEDELQSLTDAQTAVGILDSAVKGTPIADNVAPVDGASEVVIPGLSAGYYMIVDVTTNLPEGQTKSPIMLQVLESVTVASKHASIVSEKKVDDKNDSNTTEDAVAWQDVADYDIGDSVPFMISATIPSTFNTYDNYTITFHDKQAAGFDAPVITAVKIVDKDGNHKTDVPLVTDGTSPGYTLHNDCIKSDTCEFGGCSFTIEVGDINKFYTPGETVFAEGDKIVIEYTAVLNNSAAIGATGNENSMYVCHPDGHTPEDSVIVFTYELKVNKIDGTTKDPLPGAGFTLYKKIANGTWTKIGQEVTGAQLTSFIWSGIDDGVYKLEETTTPAGYNTMAPLEFTVNTDHRTEWDKGGNSAFYDVIAKDSAGHIVFADADKDGIEDGKLEGNLENNKGAVLPETGAQGTMMLIGGGAMFVTVAAVFMVTRKKMSIYED